MAGLQIFSYLPNPRVWKATIAARFCGVDVDVRGASPKELRDWLWDYDARPLGEPERQSLSSLARTGRGRADRRQAVQDGCIPRSAAVRQRSCSIRPRWKNRNLRVEQYHVGRGAAGSDDISAIRTHVWEGSRIDSFLDVSLVFARDSQIYLLALSDGTVDAAIYARAKQAFAIYASGMEQALSPQRKTLVGDDISLADICFAAELALFMNEYGRAAKLNERRRPRKDGSASISR
jgi:Glutathione S-transferase, C-terminal domain